jgi:hypothetical protein
MKTAMQELIQKIEYIAGVSSKDDNTNYQIIHQILYSANNLLEVEKKQHETTFHRGINIGAFNPELDIEGRKEAAKHYYECTFVNLNNL